MDTNSFFSVNFASIVALIIAIISGCFSVIATRRSTRPQMIQPYLDYLQNKIDILSKHLSYKSDITRDYDLSKSSGQLSAVKDIRDVYNYKESVILNEPDLFIECNAQYKKLLIFREAIDKSNAYHQLTIQFKEFTENIVFKDLEDAQYKDTHSFINALIDFSKEADELMRAEKTAAVKQLRDLTIK